MTGAIRRSWIGSGILILVSALGTQALAEAKEQAERSLDNHLHVLAQHLTTPLGMEEKAYTAVMDFIDLNGCVSDLGRYMAEELVMELVATKRLKVLERTLRRQTLEELAFTIKDLAAPGQAERLGKQLVAEMVVSGTITDGGKTVKINARIIQVSTGNILSAAGVAVPKDLFVKGLLRRSLICPKDMSTAQNPDAQENSEGDDSQDAGTKEKFSQEFSAFRVQMTRLRVGPKQITVLLTYHNKIEEPLYVALDTPKGNRTMSFMGTVPPQTKTVGPGKSYLLDTKGNRYDFVQASGLSGGWYGSYSFLGASGYLWDEGTTLLVIPPKEERSVTLMFTSGLSRKVAQKEKFDFFSGQLLVEAKEDRYGRKEVSPAGTFTLSILDIPPHG